LANCNRRPNSLKLLLSLLLSQNDCNPIATRLVDVGGRICLSFYCWDLSIYLRPLLSLVLCLSVYFLHPIYIYDHPCLDESDNVLECSVSGHTHTDWDNLTTNVWLLLFRETTHTEDNRLGLFVSLNTLALFPLIDICPLPLAQFLLFLVNYLCARNSVGFQSRAHFDILDPFL